uniref:SMP-LTD domain-containing protein n=1 Tax=Aegilops tauschii subsp. strangulata TaxID=200361 RepID=A0A453BJG5_AEGTS
KVLGSLGREDLKKLCGENFPEWISFPQYEQVKWLNKHLSKLWPFVSQAATAVVKESVEPLLDDYRPPGIKSLKFNKFSLGNVSPKIEGLIFCFSDSLVSRMHRYRYVYKYRADTDT